MRAVGKVIVERLVQSQELLGVVIAFKEDDVAGIDLANFRYHPPEHRIHPVPARLVVRTDIPGIVTDLIVRTRLVEDVVSGNHWPVRIAACELLPKRNIAILITRKRPKETDARCVVGMPMDVLPPLGRM